MNDTDQKLEAIERVACALAKGDEKKRVHWLSIADRLCMTEFGEALILRFSDAILAGNEDEQAAIALDIAKLMQRQNENFYKGRE